MKRFNFKDYFDVCCFELDINPDINFENYEYITFTNIESQKKVFNYYKEEMQQGEPINAGNIGKSFIAMTGFYDIFPKRPSWKKFKEEICPIILYEFSIENDVVLLTPININDNNHIFRTKGDKILKL